MVRMHGAQADGTSFDSHIDVFAESWNFIRCGGHCAIACRVIWGGVGGADRAASAATSSTRTSTDSRSLSSAAFATHRCRTHPVARATRIVCKMGLLVMGLRWVTHEHNRWVGGQRVLPSCRGGQGASHEPQACVCTMGQRWGPSGVRQSTSPPGARWASHGHVHPSLVRPTPP